MRIRSTKPEFWQDEKIARQLSRDARLLYKALWNESDDEGRLRGSEEYLHGVLFPYDPGQWFHDSLESIVSSGRAVRYEAEGATYLYLPKLVKNQQINKPSRSKLPAPPESSGSLPVGLPECSRTPPSLARAREEQVAGSREQVAGSREQGHGTPPASPTGARSPSDDEKAARKRTEDQAAKSEYIAEIIEGIEGIYKRTHGMCSSAGNGIKSKVAGHLVKLAKIDGFKSRSANKTEVMRIVEAYCSDPDPFVADGKHQLSMLLGERVSRYRRPLGPQEVGAGQGG